MSGSVCALVEDLPGGEEIPEAIVDRSEYRLGAGKTGLSRANAVLPAATGADADGRGRRWSRRWDRPYKRTQFGDADRDGRRPRSACGGAARADCANEPNCPASAGKRRRQPRSQARPSLGTSAKRSQFPMGGHPWARAGEAAPAAIAGPNVRNKPNSARAKRRASALWKKSYGNWTRKGPRQNKANSRTDSDGRGTARLPVSPVGPTVRNKANWPRTDRKRRWLAGSKAPPPPGTSVRNEANFRGSGRCDGSATCHCERSAAIRHRMPATPPHVSEAQRLALRRAQR